MQDAETKSPSLFISRLAKLLLLYVGSPTTHLISFCGGNRHAGTHGDSPAAYRLIAPFARFINWGVQGAITLSCPKMGYNPVEWHRKRLASQWASKISGVPEDELETQARNYISKEQSIPPLVTSSDDTSFTILIGFHTHLKHFKKCIESVVAASLKAPGVFLELLLVNDDPTIDSTLLEEITSVAPLEILIRTNKANLGICRSINETLPYARGEWILYLDCDDRLQPDAIVTLRKEIQKHPGIRFISSRTVDIDEEDRILAYQLRDESPTDLIRNNYASHLKAIRKDLHDDIGGFHSSFEGCQDFEFALRTALFEQILFIPDYLYQYRWHDRSQTVGNCNHQNEVMIRVRQTYLLAIHWILNGAVQVGFRCSGSYADEWAKKIPAFSTNQLFSIKLEAASRFSQHNYKLMLIQLANLAVTAISTGQADELAKLIV